MPTCEVDGCDKPVVNRQWPWCQKHYFRWRRHGDPTTIARPVRGVCKTDGCSRLANAKGYCAAHRLRIRDVGTDNPHRPIGSRLHQRRAVVGYDAVHVRLQSDRGPASAHLCVDCGASAAQWAYDHSDPDQLVDGGLPYSLDIARYRPLCARCHRQTDSARVRAERHAGIRAPRAKLHEAHAGTRSASVPPRLTGIR